MFDAIKNWISGTNAYMDKIQETPIIGNDITKGLIDGTINTISEKLGNALDVFNGSIGDILLEASLTVCIVGVFFSMAGGRKLGHKLTFGSLMVALLSRVVFKL